MQNFTSMVFEFHEAEFLNTNFQYYTSKFEVVNNNFKNHNLLSKTVCSE